jgi:hypothetical protein
MNVSITVERGGRIQVRAAAGGGVKPIVGEDARKTRELLRTPSIIEATFPLWARKARSF